MARRRRFERFGVAPRRRDAGDHALDGHVRELAGGDLRAGYMHGDPGYPRFFAAISLFVFSMCMLVLAGNFLLLFVFWEGVGLCSYLLIGFWFRKPSAAAAAKKAFVVNRIGDFGFAAGHLPDLDDVRLARLSTTVLDSGDPAKLADAGTATITTICLLLFLGAMGKSAQFPLHVWLPDAMEGPTPVSALIHAATMVTAGVYLVARCTPLFVLAPDAQVVVAVHRRRRRRCIAALIALTQNDLKRVLAYSTVSQLGYMFMALGGGGGPKLATVAVTAGMFHLFTHAFFKALLFLGAGSVMHAMGDVIDMRRFSGLRQVLPITHWTFLCGALALAGVLPLRRASGARTKSWRCSARQPKHGRMARYFAVILLARLLTALLTAFYTFRAYFMTFWGEERFPEEAGHHPHEAPPVMAWPLRDSWRSCAVGVGMLRADALGSPTTLHHTAAGHDGAEPHGLQWSHIDDGDRRDRWSRLSGIALAWWFYVRSPGRSSRRSAQEFGPLLYSFRSNKFYLDEIYDVAAWSRRSRMPGVFEHWFDRTRWSIGLSTASAACRWSMRPVCRCSCTTGWCRRTRW